jgi:hypothetical protein
MQLIEEREFNTRLDFPTAMLVNVNLLRYYAVSTGKYLLVF